jgi:hypothetical protein
VRICLGIFYFKNGGCSFAPAALMNSRHSTGMLVDGVAIEYLEAGPIMKGCSWEHPVKAAVKVLPFFNNVITQGLSAWFFPQNPHGFLDVI